MKGFFIHSDAGGADKKSFPDPKAEVPEHLLIKMNLWMTPLIKSGCVNVCFLFVF